MAYLYRMYMILFVVMALCFPQLASAEETAQNAPEKYVTVQMKADRTAIVPGETLRIAFEQKIYPNWHTYWINPGDTGAETRIDWTLPEGFSASSVLWPLPEKVPFADFVNFGHHDLSYLMVDITAPKKITDKTVTLTADLNWLVCQDICIPEGGRYSLTLPVAQTSEPAQAEFFAAAEKQQPQATDWKSVFSKQGETLEITVKTADAALAGKIRQAADVFWFPKEWGVIQNTADLRVSGQDGVLNLTIAAGERDLSAIAQTESVLRVVDEDGVVTGYKFTATQENLTANADTNIIVQDAPQGFWLHLLLAFLGGMVLNLMPCVFPVLSLKALSLVQHHGQNRKAMLAQGLSYTAGVVLSFAGIALVLIGLQSGGADIGWGFQLQNPYVIMGLAYLMFVIGLNLSGAFDVMGSFGNFGIGLTRGEGLKSSFFTGVLATIVATPCTAPFMAAAIGYALVQPPLQAFSIFVVLGFGLAVPYLFLTVFPPIQKILPKPGMWMEKFCQFLSLPMYITAAWLVWVLGQQAGIDGVFVVLCGFVGCAAILWARDLKTRILKYMMIVLVLLGIVAGFVKLPIITEQDTAGVAFSETVLEEALAKDTPVFVNMTAAWCITCKINERAVLKTDATTDLFQQHNVTVITGDWTRYDDNITAYLSSFQRRGVPLYVYYGARDTKTGERAAPKILPQILTPQILKETVTE